MYAVAMIIAKLYLFLYEVLTINLIVHHISRQCHRSHANHIGRPYWVKILQTVQCLLLENMTRVQKSQCYRSTAQHSFANSTTCIIYFSFATAFKLPNSACTLLDGRRTWSFVTIRRFKSFRFFNFFTLKRNKIIHLYIHNFTTRTLHSFSPIALCRF